MLKIVNVIVFFFLCVCHDISFILRYSIYFWSVSYTIYLMLISTTRRTVKKSRPWIGWCLIHPRGLRHWSRPMLSWGLLLVSLPEWRSSPVQMSCLMPTQPLISLCLDPVGWVRLLTVNLWDFMFDFHPSSAWMWLHVRTFGRFYLHSTWHWPSCLMPYFKWMT